MRFKSPIYIAVLVLILLVTIAVVTYISGGFNFKNENSLANNNSDQESVMAKGEDKHYTDHSIDEIDIKDTDDESDEKTLEEETGDAEETLETIETEGREETSIEEIWAVESSVKIIDNSPEYEVEMSLCYNKENKAFVKLEYYFDGISQSREYTSNSIPLLKQVEGTDSYAKLASHTIQEAILNSKLGKLYFFTRKDINSADVLFCLYVVDLKDGNIKEIYMGEGTELSPLKFSKDKKSAAFDYITKKDRPLPDTMLQILDCNSDEWYIVEGKTPLGNKIGQEGVPDKHYSYRVLSWITDTEVSLMEISYLKTAQNSTEITPEEIEVIYDVSEDFIKYPEGYDSKGLKIVVEQEPEEPEDSPPMKVLKSFYELVNNAEYNKAYDLLDDRFRLNAFKMFGSFEISKNEIDVEYFSEFATATGIFRSLQIKEIKKEETKDSISKIYYIQSVNLENGSSPIEMSLLATLNKVGEEWKVTALDDWVEKAPDGN